MWWCVYVEIPVYVVVCMWWCVYVEIPVYVVVCMWWCVYVEIPGSLLKSPAKTIASSAPVSRSHLLRASFTSVRMADKSSSRMCEAPG